MRKTIMIRKQEKVYVQYYSALLMVSFVFFRVFSSYGLWFYILFAMSG